MAKVKIFKTIVFSMAMVVICCGCGSALGNGSPDEQWFVDNMPEEIVIYSVPDMNREKVENIESTVTKVTIDKQVTEDKVNTAYCEITLSDEYTERTLYVVFKTKKYDKGGWQIESYDSYQADIINVKQGLSIDYIKSHIQEEYGYSGFSDYIDNSELTNNLLEYTIEVDDKHKFLDVSGNLYFKAYLEDEDLMATFPRDYSWHIEMNDEEIERVWTLDGTYEGGTDAYDFSWTLITDEDSMAWECECGYETTTEGYDSYKDVGTGEFTNALEDDETVNYAKKEFSFWCGYPWCEVTFYADRVELSIGKEEGTIDLVE